MPPVRLALRSEHGFTLIELLVVMLVIGVLAAIALPTLTNQRNKGHNASAKSQVNRLAKMIEECRTDKSSYTECDDQTKLGGAPGINWGYGAGQAGAYNVYSSANGYGAYAVSTAKAGNGLNRVFAIVKDANGTMSRPCADANGSPVVDSTCPAGTW